MEAVASMAMLGVLASSLLGAVSLMYRSQVRMQQELACAELANVVIITWLDDPLHFGDGLDDVLTYDRFEYRWELRENPVSFDATLPEGANTESFKRFTELECRVWLYDREDRFYLPKGAPNMTIRRLVSANDSLRNENTATKWINDDELIQHAFDNAVGNKQGETDTRRDRGGSRDDGDDR